MKMQISPTMWLQKTNKKVMRLTKFTLIELVVVISIIAITTTIAVSTFSGESPVRKVENATLEFQLFCTKVRYNAMESGEDRVVMFDLSSRLFSAEDPEDEEGEQLFTWELPKDFEVDSTINSSSSSVELFRFFSDGSANASLDFSICYQKLQCRFFVSPLTGLLQYSDVEAAENL